MGEGVAGEEGRLRSSRKREYFLWLLVGNKVLIFLDGDTRLLVVRWLSLGKRKEWGNLYCLLFLGWGLGNARPSLPLLLVETYNILPLCCFFSLGIPNQFAFPLPPCRVLLVTSCIFHRFYVVLNGEEQGEMNLWHLSWTWIQHLNFWWKAW